MALPVKLAQLITEGQQVEDQLSQVSNEREQLAFQVQELEARLFEAQQLLSKKNTDHRALSQQWEVIDSAIISSMETYLQERRDRQAKLRPFPPTRQERPSTPNTHVHSEHIPRETIISNQPPSNPPGTNGNIQNQYHQQPQQPYPISELPINNQAMQYPNSTQNTGIDPYNRQPQPLGTPMGQPLGTLIGQNPTEHYIEPAASIPEHNIYQSNPTITPEQPYSPEPPVPLPQAANGGVHFQGWQVD